MVEVASHALGEMSPDDVPGPLRRVKRFESRRRARLAATQIATHLETDEDFRTLVGHQLRERQPRLAGELDGGGAPPAADPVEVGAAAYLLRPEGWRERVEEAREEQRRSDTAAEQAAAEEAVARLREQVTREQESGRAEAERLRGELRDSRAEVSTLRRKLRDARDRATRAETEAGQAREEAETQRGEAEKVASSAEAELRRLRERVADAEAAAEASRRSERAGRRADDARLRVLLDSLVDAAQGLRRELALPSTISQPADVVEASAPAHPHAGVPARGLADDDPELLDNLLALPRLHLVVDGYNVTKSGYGTLPLEEQRARLLSGLAGLAAQSRVESTCVFDGAQLAGPVPTASPRGVRVLFSDPGETADAVICRLVRAEPPGRAVVVVSSDREIADDVRRQGARPVPSNLLLRRLDRG